MKKRFLESVRKKIPSDEKISMIVEDIKIFNDPSRLKILLALSIKELCVSDISFLIESSQSAVSHQLRILKKTGFVKNRRKGKFILYSVLNRKIAKLAKSRIKNLRYRGENV